MKISSSILKVCMLVLPLLAAITQVHANNDLLQQAQTENQQQAVHNIQRESGFSLTETSYLKQKSELEAQRQQLQLQTEQLSEQFSNNENLLATREEQLRLDTGSLGELFGVVRQSAKELQSELNTSVINLDRAEHSNVVDQIVAAKVLPSMSQLTGLWLSISEQIQASGELVKTNVRYINGEGVASEVPAYRIGAVGLIGEQGYLKWKTQSNDTTAFSVADYLKQPKDVAT
ncbi:MAG: flagellar motor protein MotA, partial [Psychromonas sp.]